MLIRRRTYGKTFSESFGFFMRNKNFLGAGSVLNLLLWSLDNPLVYYNAPQNIFTRCNLPEIPVGEFPKANYIGDYVLVTSDRLNSFAVGYTVNSSTIIVFTPKKIYRSLNRGVSWTPIHTLASRPYTYYSLFTDPIVWATESKYYMLCGFKGADNRPYTLYLYMYIYSVSANTGTWKLLDSLYVTDSYGLYTTYYGLGFGLRVSPFGLVMITHSDAEGHKAANGNYGYWKYLIVDFNYERISSLISLYSAITWGRYCHCGLWGWDGSTYGAFYLAIFNTQYLTETTEYLEIIKNYKIVTTPLTSANMAFTATDITSTIQTMRNLVPDLYYPAGGLSIMASAMTTTNLNRLFWYITDHGGGGTFFMCDKNLNNITKIMNWTDIPNHLNWYGGKTAFPSVLFITPNNKWGVVIGNIANMIFNLDDNTFWGGAEFSSFNGEISSSYVDNMYGFMLPKSIL